MEVARGDLVVIAVSGDYGKPRPALVVQSDEFADLNSVVVLRLSSERRDFSLFRIDVRPTPENGLRHPSQVMVDKAVTVPLARIGQRIGRLNDDTLRAVDRALGRFLGLVDPAEP